MAEVIRMPEVLAGAAEAAIQTWLIAPGTVVAVEQPLAEIETDKAIVELTAESGGTVGRLLAAEGDNVAVGDPILILLADGEGESDIAAALADAEVAGGSSEPARPAADTASVPAALGPAPQGATPTGTFHAHSTDDLSGQGRTEPEQSSTRGGRLFASPLVRKLAAQSGVELSAIEGTGPHGRVVRRDLERHLAAKKTATIAAENGIASTATPFPVPGPAVATPGVPYEDVPLDRMRKTIARRLSESKSTVPHFYLVADCRVDALLELRATVNHSAARKISVNDFVLKAVAAAMIEVPAANAIWNGDSIRRFSSVDISVAVATEGGLTTPVLRGVERAPISAVSRSVADLAERARAGRIKQHELEGGSFTVSNLGMYGTDQFSAILNPPQSGILAVGAARKAPVVNDNDELTVSTVMTVTLSADHRVLDGAVAAEWLAAFRLLIENPLRILI